MDKFWGTLSKMSLPAKFFFATSLIVAYLYLMNENYAALFWCVFSVVAIALSELFRLLVEDYQKMAEDMLSTMKLQNEIIQELKKLMH